MNEYEIKQLKAEKEFLESEFFKVVEFLGAEIGYGLTAEQVSSGGDSIGDACIRKIRDIIPDTDALEQMCATVGSRVPNLEIPAGDRRTFHLAKRLRGELLNNAGFNKIEGGDRVHG